MIPWQYVAAAAIVILVLVINEWATTRRNEIDQSFPDWVNGDKCPDYVPEWMEQEC